MKLFEYEKTNEKYGKTFYPEVKSSNALFNFNYKCLICNKKDTDECLNKLKPVYLSHGKK